MVAMMPKLVLLFSMLPFMMIVRAAPPVPPLPFRTHRQGVGCRDKVQRIPWDRLTNVERSSYIRSTICLTRRPAKHGIPGAQTLWDELQYIHIYQSAYIHFVGAFLPWHRYYLAVHASLLRRECNYRGRMPYWDQTLDLPNLRGASIFNPRTGFGGNGAGPDLCVADGPFANLRLRFTEDLDAPQSGSYCLSRNISECLFANTATANVDACQNAGSFEEAWNCLEAKPHIAGHWGIGGTMSNPHTSPGDPLFFLHHTWLDLQWHTWQLQDLPTRLSQIGGPNIPSTDGPPRGGSAPSSDGPPAPSPDGACLPPLGGPGGAALSHGAGTVLSTAAGLMEFFNDEGGPDMTLGHRLWSAGILPNATVGDVMDLGGALVCAEYV